MKIHLQKFVVVLFLALCGQPKLHAQWTTNTVQNTLVAPTATEDVKSLTDDFGNTYIAFWHNVPAPQNYEMRLQKLDTAGIAQFGVNGILVDGTTPMSSFIVTWDFAIDDSNQVYIGFTSTASGNAAVMHKISPTGTKIWGASGASLGTGYDVKLLPLSNGQIIASSSPGTYAQFRKYSANGVAMWTNAIIVTPTNAADRTYVGEMIQMAANKFEVIHYEQAGFSPYGLPFAQCYNFSGTPLWTAKVAITNGVYMQTNRRFSICNYADTVYIGFAGSLGTNIQGYIQRINPNGTLPWGVGGVDFATQNTMMERDVRIAIEGEGSKYVWAIAEFTPSSQGTVGEYVQKIDRVSGAVQLGTNAQVVFGVGVADRSHQGALRVHNNQPIFLISDGISNGVFPKDILLVRLDTLGVLNATTGLIPMATNALGVKSRINLTGIVNENVVAVWSENRGTSLPYAQKYSLAVCTLPTSNFVATAALLATTIYANSNHADSVYYDFGDGTFLSDTAAIVNHNYAAAGTYNICQYTFNNCGADTICQTITICTALNNQFSFTSTLKGGEILFTANLSANDSAFWQFGDGTSASRMVDTVTHAYTTGGSFLVILEIFNACGQDSSSAVVSFSGIDEENGQSKFSFSPLPANDQLYCEIPPFWQSNLVEIQILELSGKFVSEFRLDDVQPGQVVQLPVAQLAQGTYLVKIEGESSATKILISR